jgi:hypothetical protein
MLSYELRLEKQSGGGYSSYSSANSATCGRGAPWSRGGPTRCGRDRGHAPRCGSGPGSSRGGYNKNAHRPALSTDSSGGSSKPRCQVCMKPGHTANICWYRFDEEFIPDNRLATMVSSSRGNDPNWYIDSGATDHITGELEKLMMHECFHGKEKIRAANGAGMNIVHIGKSILPSSTCPLHLNHVLHVPRAHKHLVPFIGSILIIIISLNYIHSFSLSRIRPRGGCSCKAHVKEIFIHCRCSPCHLQLRSSFYPPSSQPPHDGIED